MVEPYLSPESDCSTRSNKNGPSFFKVLGLIFACLLAAFLYKAPSVLADTFSELFEGFGADLPALTAFMLPRFKYFKILSVISILLMFFIPIMHGKSEWRKRVFRMVIINLILSFIFFVVAIISVYLAILTLNSVV